MRIYGIQTNVIQIGDDIADIFLQSLTTPLSENSIVLVTSKIVAVSQGRIKRFATEAEFEQIVQDEADEVLGYAEQAKMFLTRKNGLVMPNAGIDKSNAEEGSCILLPTDWQALVDEFRTELQQYFNIQKLGVILVDSRVVSFRLGITGVAMAWSGFVGVSDERGKADLFGKKLAVSQIAVADNLASIAQIFFGQSAEQTPFVVCEDVPVHFTDEKQDYRSAQIPPEDDLYAELSSNR